MMPERLSQHLPHMEVDPRILSALVCGSAVALLALKWTRQRRLKQKLEEARRKRAHALLQMEKISLQFKEQNPSVHPDAILSLPLTELVEKLREGSLSPETVLYTYIGKALEVTNEVNCLTDFLPECVAQLQDMKKQKERGPLYGVPVSIKEHYDYKGHDSPCGLAYFLGTLAQEDSVIIQVLKKQGAIPFVKTNVPQSMFSFACSNPIFGQTLNPHNHKKTSGGSSGGEGALIGGGGAILGFGSDIAGSIRMPSSFCGICGIKPTEGRISICGINSPVFGIKSVHPAIGPMARDVDSLALCMKALLCDHMFHLDPSVPPIPFRDEVKRQEDISNAKLGSFFEFSSMPKCKRKLRGAQPPDVDSSASRQTSITAFAVLNPKGISAVTGAEKSLDLEGEVSLSSRSPAEFQSSQVSVWRSQSIEETSLQLVWSGPSSEAQQSVQSPALVSLDQLSGNLPLTSIGGNMESGEDHASFSVEQIIIPALVKPAEVTLEAIWTALEAMHKVCVSFISVSTSTSRIKLVEERLEALETKISCLESDSTQLKESQQALIQDRLLFLRKLENMDNYTRNLNLRIHNFP